MSWLGHILRGNQEVHDIFQAISKLHFDFDSENDSLTGTPVKLAQCVRIAQG